MSRNKNQTKPKNQPKLIHERDIQNSKIFFLLFLNMYKGRVVICGANSSLPILTQLESEYNYESVGRIVAQGINGQQQQQQQQQKQDKLLRLMKYSFSKKMSLEVEAFLRNGSDVSERLRYNDFRIFAWRSKTLLS
jgi:hypothetical protein